MNIHEDTTKRTNEQTKVYVVWHLLSTST